MGFYTPSISVCSLLLWLVVSLCISAPALFSEKVRNMSPDKIRIPPEPPGRCSSHLQVHTDTPGLCLPLTPPLTLVMYCISTYPYFNSPELACAISPPRLHILHTCEIPLSTLVWSPGLNNHHFHICPTGLQYHHSQQWHGQLSVNK